MRNHWSGNHFKGETSEGATSKKGRYRKTTEYYNIDPDIWTAMDSDIRRIKIPTSFGDKIRGIYDFNKANEWKTWVKVRNLSVLMDLADIYRLCPLLYYLGV